VSTPRFPDQNEDTTPAKSITWKATAIIAAVVVVLALVIALHVARVFGP
jgi:hypothetical protein